MCVSVETKILWLKQRQPIDSKRAKMDGERNNIEPFTSIVTLKTCSIFWQAIVRAKNDGREKKRAREKEEEEEKAMPKLLWFFPWWFPVCLFLSVCVRFLLLLFFSEICLPSMLTNSLRMRMSLISKHAYWPLIRSSHLYLVLTWCFCCICYRNWSQ